MTPTDLQVKLDSLLRLPAETEWVEFKEAKSNFDSDDLGKYFSALSNETNLKGQTAGWLVFGVKDKPRKVVGSQYRPHRASLDSLKQEVAQHTTGRITFVEIHELQLPQGRVVMFEIPPAPRGIPIAWKGHFYGRDADALGALNLQEIDQIRGQTGHQAGFIQTVEQVRRFRMERVNQILAGETPTRLQSRPKAILHIVPLESVSAATKIDFSAASALAGGLLCPLGTAVCGSRVNLEGLLTFTGMGLPNSISGGYLQLYRNGIIETVDANTLTEGPTHPQAGQIIPSTLFERSLIDQIPKYMLALQKLGANPPFVIMLTLLGVKGFCMPVSAGRFTRGFDRDEILIDEIILEKSECRPVEIKPMLDAVWNGVGVVRSPSFDSEGNYLP
jgi:hypothetical protein